MENPIRSVGWRSYVPHIPVVAEKRRRSYLAKFGAPAEIPVFEAPICGSKNCPTIDTVRAIFNARNDCLRRHYSSGNELAIAHWNSIAATTSLAELVLTFRRSYPWTPPSVGILDADYGDLIAEKGSRAIWIPRVLKVVLRASSQKLRILIDRMETDRIEVLGFPAAKPAYHFLGPVIKGVCVAQPIRWRRIADGLADYGSTAGFAGLHHNSMRNFSNFYLRFFSDLHEQDIRTLHDHAAGSLNPMHRSRFEEVINRRLCEKAAAILAAGCGI